MTPETVLLCPVLALVALLWARQGLDARERQIVTAALIAHVLGSFAIVVYHEDIYRGGDMWWYTMHGKQLAALMRRDLTAWAPEVLNLALHRENHLPITVLLEGTSTGTMSAIAGFLMLATGDSVYGGSLLVSTFAFIGSVSLFRSFVHELRPFERHPVLVATLLVPSAIFWSSGIVKEAIVLGALGVLCLGIARVLRFELFGVVGIVMGAVVISVVKPYVLFAVSLAFAGAFYGQRRERLSWVSKAAAVPLAVGAVIGMTRLFPEFGIDRIGETMARTQYNFTITAGGSNVELGVVDDDAIAGASLLGQLRFLPLALLNVFARPVIFEVRNVSQAIAAVEMTVIVVLGFVTLRRFGVRRAWSELTSSRWSTFCLVFILVFAPPVGLATGNLGTLSRYRVPMMPMYAATLLALRARLFAGERGREPAALTREVRSLRRPRPHRLSPRTRSATAKAAGSAR